MANNRRRRFVKRSTAVDYDRTADSEILKPLGDADRDVLLDPEQEESATTSEFWKEQQPPHYN